MYLLYWIYIAFIFISKHHVGFVILFHCLSQHMYYFHLLTTDLLESVLFLNKLVYTVMLLKYCLHLPFSTTADSAVIIIILTVYTVIIFIQDITRPIALT